MLWVVLALLATQDDALDALSDNDPGVRAQAETSLATLGESARTLLRRGSTHPDPETRSACGRLLARLDRELADALQEKLQRPDRLNLVTIEAVDRPFEEVLQQLSRRTRIPYDPTGLDRNRRVTVRVRDANVLQFMDEWGLTRDRYIERRTARSPSNPAYTDGARFEFASLPWEPQGVRRGFVFETKLTKDFGGDLEWDVASILSGRDRPFETCRIHSPGLVYVPDPELDSARVTLRGVRRWYCETTIVILDPRRGDTRRTKGFAIEVQWPQVIVRSDQPIAQRVLERTLTSADIDWDVRPECRRNYCGGCRGYLVRRGCGGYEPVERAWCGCEGKPSEGRPESSPMVREMSVVSSGADRYDLSEIERITITIRRPIEEPFEVVSPELRLR